MLDQEYVDVQHKVNDRHSNGKQEATYEEASEEALWLCRWIKKSNLQAPTSFLDLGCRTGYAMEVFQTEYPTADVLGIDIVPEFIKVAQNRGEAIVGDMHALELPNRSYDWVFSCTSIEHCHDAKKAADEMLRVANIGVYVRTDLEDKERFEANPSHFTYHNDPLEWCDLFRHPDWWLLRLDVPRYSRISMLLVRKEYLNRWNEVDDTWRL